MRKPLALFALSAVLALAACSQPEPPPPEPVGERVENPDMELAIAALPEPFAVVTASGPTIELTAPGENGAGTVTMSLAEPQRHVNLVAAADERQAAFEATPGATFFGRRSLGGPLGNVFTARGELDGEDGTRVEETWAYALHPLDPMRMLTIVYRYPAGESQERVNQLLYLLGEIEGTGDPGS